MLLCTQDVAFLSTTADMPIRDKIQMCEGFTQGSRAYRQARCLVLPLHLLWDLAFFVTSRSQLCCVEITDKTDADHLLENGQSFETFHP